MSANKYSVLAEREKGRYDYFLRKLLLEDPDNPTDLTPIIEHENLKSISAFTDLSNEDIGNLSYPVTKNRVTEYRKIAMWTAAKIKKVIAHHAEECHKQQRLIPWEEITQEGIQRFTLIYDPSKVYKRYQPPTAEISTHGYHLPKKEDRSPAAKFRSNTKKDADQFPNLDSDLQWNSYKKKLLAVMKSQGIERLLTSWLHPAKDQEEAELIKAYNEYLWNVFNDTLHTGIGLELLATHQRGRDAQKVYQGLVKYYENSIMIGKKTNETYDQLTKASILERGEGTPREHYISQWVTTASEYNGIAGAKRQISDSICKNMLVKMVEADKELAMVSDQEDIGREIGKPPFKYQEYVAKLLTEAKRIDREDPQIKAAKAKKPAERTPSSKTRIRIKNPATQVPCLSLDRETWESLGEDAQAAWESMTPHARNSILKCSRSNEERANSSNTTTPQHHEGNPSTTVATTTQHPDGNPSYIRESGPSGTIPGSRGAILGSGNVPG